jgi:hypothetical protein
MPRSETQHIREGAKPMTTTDAIRGERTDSQGAAPSLVGPSFATAGLFLANIFIVLTFAGELYFNPFDADGSVQQAHADHSTAVKWVALVQFLSALAFASFTAVLWARLKALAPRATAPLYLVAVGGTIASVLMAVCALIQWTLAFPAVHQEEGWQGLQLLYFGLGGFGHVAAAGLLVGAASAIARRGRLLPSWLSVAGLVIAVISVGSVATFVAEPATSLIPLGRFPTFIWMILLAFMLPRSRTTA